MTAPPVRLLDLGEVPALHSQAVYHVLAEQMGPDRPDTVVLCRPAGPYVCLGYHQRGSDVLDYGAATALGLPIVRRRVGGGLTYLDPDQVFYQFIFHHSRVPRVPARMYAWLLSVPVAALRRLGVPAELQRTNEIEVPHGESARRIAGIGAGRIGEASVVVGNVLVDFDYEAMIAVWPEAGDGYRELAAEAVRRRVTTLRREGSAVSAVDVEGALRAVLADCLDRRVVPGELAAAERSALDPMAERLTDPERVRRYEDEPARRRPPLKVSARAYVVPVAGQIGAFDVRGALLTREDRVVDARLESVPPRDWADARCALIGSAASTWDVVLRAAL